MTKKVLAAACAAMMLVMAFGVPAVAGAQSMGGANAKYVPDPGVTLKVTVTISRWEGDRKVASAPYVLMVVPSWGPRAEQGVDGEATSLQMGSDFPLPASTVMVEGKSVTGLSYKALGTNIRIAAKPADEGRYNMFVMVQDSQVERPQNQNQVVPSFQTFRADNRLTMRDGQTTQYTVATNSINGQVVKLDVTLNVMK